MGLYTDPNYFEKQAYFRRRRFEKKMISALGTIGGTLYNLLYVAMVVIPVLALPLRWWWKIALLASVFIPLLGGLILYILEFVSFAIILGGAQNWFAVVYYIQFVIFLILVFAPFLMAFFSVVLKKLGE